MARTAKTRQRSRNARRSPSPLFPSGEPLALFDGLCRKTLATQGREVLASGDPLEAEMWVSYLLGMFSGLPLIGEPDPAEAIGGRLVSVAQKRRTPEAQMCLRALAAVASRGLAGRAKKATASLGMAASQVPSWTRTIGTAQATSAWRASDLSGDQDSIMVGFRYPDGSEHCALVLVDHLLGGIAKDATVLWTPIAEVLQGWEGPEFDLVEESLAEAAGRIMAAVTITERSIGAPITEDCTDAAALLKARFGPVAGEVSTPAPLPPIERKHLAREFLAAEAGRRFAHDPDACLLLDALIDWRCDAGADPLRWSDSAIELFLLGSMPRRLVAPDAVSRRMPEVLGAWVPWAATRAGLPEFLAQEALAMIAEIGDEALEALSDQTRWSPAKRRAMQMFAGEVDLTEGDAEGEWPLSGAG